MSEEATATAEATDKAELNLTGPQKDAILIMSVGTKSATEMMKSLTEKEIEQITLEIARMKNIRPEMVDAVLQEYYTLMEVKQYVINGGMDYAQQLLNELGGDSEKMMKKLRAQSGSTVFKEFQETKTTQIADFIRGEHPQVAALIFSQLRVEKTAEILALLDKEMQGEITYRLAMMETISPDVIDEIEEVIKEHMGGMDNLGEYREERYKYCGSDFERCRCEGRKKRTRSHRRTRPGSCAGNQRADVPIRRYRTLRRQNYSNRYQRARQTGYGTWFKRCG